MTKKDEAKKLKESVRRAKVRIEAESYLDANGLDADVLYIDTVAQRLFWLAVDDRDVEAARLLLELAGWTPEQLTEEGGEDGEAVD